MDQIKKTSIRFNLENEQDKEIWDAIQQKPEKKKNTYIKFLIWAGLHQEQQQKVLDELSELKNMLMQSDIQVSLNKKSETVEETEIVEQQKQSFEPMEETQTEPIEIDAEVMNFLDNL